MFHISVCTPPPSALASCLLRPASVPIVGGLAPSTNSSVAPTRRRARARSSSSACRARRSRGDGEREAAASRAVVTFVAALQHHPRRVEGDENEGDEGGARLVRAHGGEKSRAPHPLWHVRGGNERSMEGERFIPHYFLSLFLSFRISLPCVHHRHKHTWSALSYVYVCMCARAKYCHRQVCACARVVDQWAKNIGESFFPSPHARDSPTRVDDRIYFRARDPLPSTASFIGGGVGRVNKYVRRRVALKKLRKASLRCFRQGPSDHCHYIWCPLGYCKCMLTRCLDRMIQVELNGT